MLWKLTPYASSDPAARLAPVCQPRNRAPARPRGVTHPATGTAQGPGIQRSLYQYLNPEGAILLLFNAACSPSKASSPQQG